MCLRVCVCAHARARACVRAWARAGTHAQDKTGQRTTRARGVSRRRSPWELAEGPQSGGPSKGYGLATSIGRGSLRATRAPHPNADPRHPPPSPPRPRPPAPAPPPGLPHSARPPPPTGPSPLSRQGYPSPSWRRRPEPAQANKAPPARPPAAPIAAPAAPLRPRPEGLLWPCPGRARRELPGSLTRPPTTTAAAAAAARPGLVPAHQERPDLNRGPRRRGGGRPDPAQAAPGWRRGRARLGAAAWRHTPGRHLRRLGSERRRRRLGSERLDAAGAGAQTQPAFPGRTMTARGAAAYASGLFAAGPAARQRCRGSIRVAAFARGNIGPGVTPVKLTLAHRQPEFKLARAPPGRGCFNRASPGRRDSVNPAAAAATRTRARVTSESRVGNGGDGHAGSNLT